MRLFDFFSSSFSSIKSGLQNVAGGAQSWVSGKIKNTIASTVDTIAESAVNATERKIKSSIETIASQLGVKSKETVESVQAVVENGIKESNQKVDNVILKYNQLMQQFRESLDQRKAQQAQGLEDESVLDLDTGEKLYKSLDELGQAFKEGKIKLEAFAKLGKASIEEAKPKIEELLGQAFIEAVINPLLGFFKDLVGSLVKSIFQDLSKGFVQEEQDQSEKVPSFRR